MDTAATLTAVSNLVIPAVADLCAVYLIDSAAQQLERAEVFCGLPDKHDTIARLREMPTFSLERARPAFETLSRGTAPMLLSGLPAGFWSRLARDDEHRALLESLDVREILAVPLVARGRVLGVMALATLAQERNYAADDITFVSEIGRRVAVAIDNARLFNAARDATTRSDAAKVLADTLLAAAPVGFAQLDCALRIVRVNDAMASMHGYPPEKHEGQTLPELFGASGVELERPFRQVLETGVPVQGMDVIADFRGMNGEQRNLSMNVYPVRATSGDLLGVAGVAIDVTEGVRARRTLSFLANASQRLSESLDYDATLNRVARLGLGVFADYCVVYLPPDGPYAERFVDAHVDPDLEPVAHELLLAHPPNVEDYGMLARVLREGVPLLEAHVQLGKTGLTDSSSGVPGHLELLPALRVHSAMAVPLETRGEIIGVLALMRSKVKRPYDATEVALAEELARRAAAAIDNARLFHETERANRAKADFLATMSHELRTPLNAIAGYAELLELGIHGPVTPLQIDDLKRIQRSQKHLLGLINDILSFAKLEAGRVTFHLGAVNLDAALSTVGELVVPQANAKGVKYEFRVGEQHVLARADEDKLQQIIVNLLSNAVKFTERGGTVTLWSEASGQRVRIHVQDSGIGIDAEKLEAIFEPFVQVGRTLSHPQEGTGLGLAISRELARAMGGSLGAASQPGVGSTFTLTLERAEARRASAEMRAIQDGKL